MMFQLGLVLIVVGFLLLALAPRTNAGRVQDLWWALVVVGVVLLVVDVLADDAEAAAAGFAPGVRLARLRDWRYEIDRAKDLACLRLAHRAPGRLRMWFVVAATTTARQLYPHPSGYAGPDGLTYEHLHDGALRRALPSRPAAELPDAGTALSQAAERIRDEIDAGLLDEGNATSDHAAFKFARIAAQELGVPYDEVRRPASSRVANGDEFPRL
jgi:hypothetical protein